MQSSRGMPVGTVELVPDTCGELEAFRGSCVEEVVRELSFEGQAGLLRDPGGEVSQAQGTS